MFGNVHRFVLGLGDGCHVINLCVCDMVKQSHNKQDSQEPKHSWCPSAVHECLWCSLNILHLAFTRILVLMAGFTVVLDDVAIVQDVQNFHGSLLPCIVRHDFSRSSPFLDEFLQCLWESWLSRHRDCVCVNLDDCDPKCAGTNNEHTSLDGWPVLCTC